MKGLAGSIAAAALALAVHGSDITETADFTAGAVPEGWTAAEGSLRSPVFGEAAVRIEFAYSGTGAPGAGRATIFASAPGAAQESQIAVVNTFTRNAAFDIDPANGFVSFRIEHDASFVPQSFAATWRNPVPPAPENVAVADWSASSVTLSWSASDGAAAYELLAWTNTVVGASAGTTVWTETFANATGGTGGSAMGDAAAAACFDNEGWEWPDKLYRASEDGAVRIGTTSNSGRLVSPALPAGENRHLRIRLQGVKDSNNDVLLQIVRGGATNDIGSVQAPSEWAEYVLALPALEGGDRLVINSVASGDRRTAIDEVAIVSGYSAGEPGIDILKTVRVSGDATSGTIDGLPSVALFAGVRAAGSAEGAVSETAGGIEADLARAPVKAISLDACAGAYSQDFSALPQAQSVWTNHLTLAGWSAMYDGAAPETIRKATLKTSTGGLYTCVTNEYAASPALGCLSTKEKTACFEVSFTNDTQYAQTVSAVSFQAQQWGFQNGNKDQRLRLTAGPAGAADADRTELCAIQPALAKDDTPAGFPAVQNVSLAPESLEIPAGGTLTLRWTLDKHTDGGALMAIDDLSVTFTPHIPERFSIRIASSPQRPARTR